MFIRYALKKKKKEKIMKLGEGIACGELKALIYMWDPLQQRVERMV